MNGSSCFRPEELGAVANGREMSVERAQHAEDCSGCHYLLNGPGLGMFKDGEPSPEIEGPVGAAEKSVSTLEIIREHTVLRRTFFVTSVALVFAFIWFVKSAVDFFMGFLPS